MSMFVDSAVKIWPVRQAQQHSIRLYDGQAPVQPVVGLGSGAGESEVAQPQAPVDA